MLSKNNQLILRILNFHGLNVRAILTSSKGYRNYTTPVVLNSGEMVNVIIYKREDGIVDTIRRADAVSNFLSERGLPTRHSLSSRLIVIGKDENKRYANIYDYLPGDTIPWEAYTKGHIKALGASMSDMHAILSSYDHLIQLPNVEDIYESTLSRMSLYFASPGVQQAMKEKLKIVFNIRNLATYSALLETCKSLGDRQALHMDFVRGNILFSGEKVDGLPVISGILDLEKTAVGHHMFDIARTLAFLLVDCKYKTSEKVTDYFLDSGYMKRGSTPIQKIAVNISNERHDLLALLLDMFLLHDFYKFLRHNPYEDLSRNEHYERTCDILLRRKLIQRI